MRLRELSLKVINKDGSKYNLHIQGIQKIDFIDKVIQFTDITKGISAVVYINNCYHVSNNYSKDIITLISLAELRKYLVKNVYADYKVKKKEKIEKR